MWIDRGEQIQHRLIRAVPEARVPELLVQAENDHDLSPSKIAGAELERVPRIAVSSVAPPRQWRTTTFPNTRWVL